MPSPCPVCSCGGATVLRNFRGEVSPFSDKGRQIVLCQECQLGFIDPMPSESELNEFNIRYWTAEESLQLSNVTALNCYRAQAESRVDFISSLGVDFNGKDILDFGASYGAFNDSLRNKGVSDIRYYAVESDVTICQEMKKRGLMYSQSIEEFKDKAFDVIILSHVLEHIAEPLSFLEMLRSRLKYKGFIFIEVPNRDYLWKKTDGAHLLFFSLNSMRYLLKKIGMDHAEIKTCGRPLESLIKQNENKLSVYRRVRAYAGRLLRFLKIIKKADNIETQVDDFSRIYQMKEYGADNQWLRIFITNDNDRSLLI